MNKFYVCSVSGGYSEPMDWLEAEELAIEESKNGDIRFIQDEKTQEYVALFYEGKRWIQADGQSCEHCGWVEYPEWDAVQVRAICFLKLF